MKSLAVGLVVAFTLTTLGAQSDRLVQVWSLDGEWTGIASDDQAGLIYAVGSGALRWPATGRGYAVIDPTGRILREIALPPESDGGPILLRLARFSGLAGMALLTFSPFTPYGLVACDPNGQLLWRYPALTAINDVWAADLTGDGSDEVIVGYNGDTGLHILNSEGQLLWKSTAIGNVWHVSAGHVWANDATSQVVTTSASGRVHVFGGEGFRRQDLDVAPVYADMVRVGKIAEGDMVATIFAIGPVDENGPARSTRGVVTALAPSGARKWSLPLPSEQSAFPNSTALASGKPWMAVGLGLGSAARVHVIDIEKGSAIATAEVPAMRAIPEVGWAADPNTNTPLLLVTSGGRLSAFRVTETR